ncbi:MAG: FAD binding domain-containing protein [Candidatus Marinimicrobia bacterium]|nr:FAD binding domain-containing protein [Candidatus Neomarinimicrobiota bacterium]MDP7653528.1 FAD binding domain-containing protein [Candidatus Neomarinimicrobiota bacterium]
MDFYTVSPQTATELLEAIKQNQKNHFRFGAGYTDLIPELKTQKQDDLTVINLAKLKDKDFTSINDSKEGSRIGALATMTDVLSNESLQRFPALIEAIESLASVQVRSVATVGGNICTASPAGDVSCALVALDAACEILDTGGKIRTVPIAEFFTGVKTSVLKKNEILRSVLVPHRKTTDRIVSGFIKIGNRNSMEIALVSFAYYILADSNGDVTSSGAAIGSVAETIKSTESACEFLMGKNIEHLTKTDKGKFADLVLEYACPISDIRASAWYRRQVLWNISRSIF